MIKRSHAHQAVNTHINHVAHDQKYPNLNSQNPTTPKDINQNNINSNNDNNNNDDNNNNHQQQESSTENSADETTAPSPWRRPLRLIVLLSVMASGLCYLGRPFPQTAKDADAAEASSTSKSASAAGAASLVAKNGDAINNAADDDNVSNEDDTSWEILSVLRRAYTRMTSVRNPYLEPAFDLLLPDELPPPYNRKYTLLINLNDTLVHSSWDRAHGWRVAINPQAARFLRYLCEYYEIVLFTTSQSHIANPLIDAADSLRGIQYRLFRDATVYQVNASSSSSSSGTAAATDIDLTYVKDITHLNRDPARVVALDLSQKKYPNFEGNVIEVPPWDGRANTSTLFDHLPFLETLALSNVSDVRPVLKRYRDTGLPIPVAFEQRRQQLAMRSSRGVSSSSSSSKATAPATEPANSHDVNAQTPPQGGLWAWMFGTGKVSDDSAASSAPISAPEAADPGRGTTVARSDSVTKHMERMQNLFLKQEPLIKAELEHALREQERENAMSLSSLKRPMTLWEFWNDVYSRIRQAGAEQAN